MPFVGSLYSRPRIVPVCIEALMEKIEGRITQAELEERMRGLESRQLEIPLNPPFAKGEAKGRGIRDYGE